MRLPFEMAVMDPAFVRCQFEAIETDELVQNFDRLYHANLSKTPSEGDMRAFSRFVYDSIYTRLDDVTLEALRAPYRSKG